MVTRPTRLIPFSWIFIVATAAQAAQPEFETACKLDTAMCTRGQP